MIALVFAGGRSALTVTVLKSAFVLLTRGVIAGVMSGVGSILALTALVFLLRPGGKNSLIFSAAVAAVCHAVGQLAMSAIITGSVYVIIYAPLPIVAAIVAGVCTGIVTESIIKLNIYNSEIINGNKKLGRQQTRSQ
jgi:heptaprenyl diphosphate synthase